MKRIALAALAAATFAAPFATATAYADPPRYDRGDRNNDRNDGDRNDNDRNGDWNNNDRNGDWNDGRRGDNDRRDHQRRGHRHDDRRGDRDGRDGRWDRGQHNGYTYNGRWNYGPPPAAYEYDRGYQPGYQNWRRGDRLPSYYRSSYRGVDYRRAHLRAPPRGYNYVEDDRGEYLLVGIATGVILSVILNNDRY